MKLQVAHFQRRPRPGNFSVERLFEDTRGAMPSDIEVVVHVNEYTSRGIVWRVKDALRVRRLQRQVNHILGDVHYLTWFLPRDRTVLTILDCVSLERLQGIRRSIFWFLWYWVPLKKSGRVTVISTFTRDSLLKWVKYPPELIHVIPPPLCPRFRRSADVDPSERPRILQVGTKKNKNVRRLIEALNGIDATLVVVGAMDESLTEAAKQHGVDVENHVDADLDQLIELYRGCHLLAFVSTYEGFGMPIVEAQAVGRPVVTSNCCSMPETAGGAALLVDPYDVGQIKAGILMVLQDEGLARTLVQRGFENAKRFAPGRIAEEYASLYRAIDSVAPKKT